MYEIELVVNVIDLRPGEVWLPRVIELKLLFNLIHNLHLLFYFYLFFTLRIINFFIINCLNPTSTFLLG